MVDPLAQHGTRVTPQSRPAREDQQVNHAGGFTFTLTPRAQLRRFLILGTDGGTYYATEADHTRDNADLVKRLVALDGHAVLQEVLEVSLGGLAKRQNPTLVTLAALCGAPDETVRREAVARIPEVCRTATMLFTFMGYVEGFRGWGRSLRRGVASWYTHQSESDLAYQLVKYRQREGYTHRDALRLSHPTATDGGHRRLLEWAVAYATKGNLAGWPGGDESRIVEGFMRCQQAPTAKAAAELITDYRLPWECVPDQHINDPAVWAALLPHLGVGALVRQLGRMTSIGLLGPMTAEARMVAQRLQEPGDITRARLHPMAILLGMATYATGHGFRGNLTWSPNRQVLDALDAAFYLAFGNVTPAGKRTMLALDVSGSMGSSVIGGTALTAREASAAMALVTAATEPEWMAVGFTAGSSRVLGRRGDTGLTDLTISPRQRLTDVVKEVSHYDFGATDCALPMTEALRRGLEVDTFIIYTDNETWHGTIHPHQALVQYRERTGIPARLIVVGMTATQFTIADPMDQGMLDVVGFDASAPNMMAAFSRGDLSPTPA